MKILLWPSEPIDVQGSTDQELRDRIFPSGRQGVTFAVGLLGGERTDLIALPEYASHCVISAVGKLATPLPIPVAVSVRKSISTVLLYSQWGWERPFTALEEVRDAFSGAGIIMDRVDSMTNDLKTWPEKWDKDLVQVLSFSKTLGLAGGGMVSWNGLWQCPNLQSDPDTRTIGGGLARMAAALPEDSSHRTTLAHWQMSDIDRLSDPLDRWLKRQDLAEAFVRAAEGRDACLKVVGEYAGRLNLPDWMSSQIEDSDPVYPGILPLFAGDHQASQTLIDKVQERTAVRSALYHFDQSDSYLRPDWRLCVAVPMHWQMAPEVLEWIILQCR